jgi:two-component system, NarL family, nitrate/nitrite sensor histidine kinase NarX
MAGMSSEREQSLQAQVQELELQLRLHHSDMQTVAQEERVKIAHEIHDSLAQTIASLKLRFDILERTISLNDSRNTSQNLKKIKQGVNQANTEIRELIKNYRAPVNIKSLRLGLEQLVNDFRANNDDINIFLEINCWPWPKNENIKTQVYRIAQEALTNIAKHSQANFARILLDCSQYGIKLLIEDDGIGFTPTLNERENSGKHVGITTMRERAESIGGTLNIESEEEEGCRVHLSVRTKE